MLHGHRIGFAAAPNTSQSRETQWLPAHHHAKAPPAASRPLDRLFHSRHEHRHGPGADGGLLPPGGTSEEQRPPAQAHPAQRGGRQKRWRLPLPKRCHLRPRWLPPQTLRRQCRSNSPAGALGERGTWAKRVTFGVELGRFSPHRQPVLPTWGRGTAPDGSVSRHGSTAKHPYGCATPPELEIEP